MPLIHTLGPDTTDSYDAATHIPGRRAPEIRMHSSFDEIIAHLDRYVGDQFLLPTAYQSTRPDFGWRELCYEYSDRLQMAQVFNRHLQPMCLIENRHYKENVAMIHPATENLLRHALPDGDYTVRFAGSKAAAYADYLLMHYRYSIVSQNVLRPGERVLATYRPDMVWCLYDIVASAGAKEKTATR